MAIDMMNTDARIAPPDDSIEPFFVFEVAPLLLLSCLSFVIKGGMFIQYLGKVPDYTRFTPKFIVMAEPILDSHYNLA